MGKIVYLQYWQNIASFLKRYLSRYDLILLFVIACVIRFIHLDMMLDQIGVDTLLSLAPDTVRYVNIGTGFSNFEIVDEGAILIFGPGYGAFLGLCFLLFGQQPLPIIFIQIILSSLGCLLLYKLGKELTGSKAIGYLAGLLAATSFTSVSLSNYILSDSLFFFLFLAGNLLFLLGLKGRDKKYFIASGVFIGLAILVRSIGQFWPFLMLAFIFILPLGKEIGWRITDRIRLLKIAYWGPLIALIIISLWLGRNFYYHDYALMTTASSGGPANIAAIVQAEEEGRDYGELRSSWGEAYKKKTGLSDLNQIDVYKLNAEVSREVMGKYPVQFFKKYKDLIWENLNAVNELHRSQLPNHWVPIVEAQTYLFETFGKQAVFYYSIVGFLFLIVFGRFKAAIFLASMFVYFALLIGVTQWQGSRLFYPGQIAWSILISFLIIRTCSFVTTLIARIGRFLKKTANARMGRKLK